MQAQPELIAAAQRIAEGTGTQEDATLLAQVDDATKADLRLVLAMDEQTRADVALVATIDEQTQSDAELMSTIDEQTKADMQTMADADEQARSDLELVSNLDDKTRSNLELLTDLDETTQKDVDLVRAMDRDLLDDLRLVANIDEDAHVINTQTNSAATVAQAEKYAMTTVEVERVFGGENEEVTVYGIQPNSAYWTGIPVSSGAIVAGRGLTEKTKAQVGTPFAAHNRRKGEEYQVTIGRVASNAADTNLYMSIDDFNQLFGNDADYFNAYASAEELALDDRYVATSIVPEDMDEISNQMQESMGNIMTMMMLISVPIYLILLYLLTKTVIDRSARSISYMKVFGYHSGEVDGLYIHPITIFVLLSLLASIPLIIALLAGLLKVVFSRYAGNFPINIPPDRLALLVLVGMVAYGAVAALHVRRIRKVPLSLALKVQE
jgi:putative ABC transport system permease protein